MNRTHHFHTRFVPVVVLALFGVGASLVQAAGQRCNLVSQSRCLDLSKLDGASIQVPLSTTRISSEGLNLCGVPGSTGQPVDIAYVLDQSLSNLPVAIQMRGNDTGGYVPDIGQVNPPTKPCIFPGTPITNFHDARGVHIIPDSLSEAEIEASCLVAGDAYGVRSSTVQRAIALQATRAPGSYATTIGFAAEVMHSQAAMTYLNPAGVTALQATVWNEYVAGTSYENPLTWSRILLHGGYSDGPNPQWIPHSPNPNKAIIMISDGRPTSGDWQSALAPKHSILGPGLLPGLWTTGSDSVPPIYTIFLGVDSVEGSVLQTLSGMTGGKYFMVPPSKPDSLDRAIQEILGMVIKPAIPDSLVVTNATNGQTSHSVAVAPNGASYQMALDSLVALDSGTNHLKLTVKGASNVVTANWTVLVADSTGSKPKGALDSLLTTQCGLPSAITLTPDKSGLAWADTVDRNLLIGLSAMPENYSALPVSLSTRKSADAENISMPVPTGSDPQMALTFRGAIPWQNLSGKSSVPGDAVLRSGPEWDSARAFFQMPRDPRDTASFMIGLHHSTATRLCFVDASGNPLDSIKLSMAVDGKMRLTLAEFIGNNICTTCNNMVTISPSDLAIIVNATTGAGNPIDSVRLVNGQAVVEVHCETPILAGSITFWADSIASSLVAKPIRVNPLLPDSVVYFDDNGDGTLDRAEIHLNMPWRNGNRLQLPWPDSSTLLDYASADSSISPDSLVITYVFHSGTPLTTAAKGTLVAKWRYSDAWPWANVKVVERIAPVPLRAILRRGAIYDTLRVSASERIRPVLTPVTELVTNVFKDGTFGTISPRQASLDAVTGELVLVFAADSTDLQVLPGDSIRFTWGGAVRDSLGNVPGEHARRVIVEGLDHAPTSAFIFDTDADGRADRIVVHLRAPLTVADRIGFLWPDTLGNLQERELPVSAAHFDSLGRVLTFDVDPFAFGATSCPRDGCQNLGWLSSTRFPDAGRVVFPVQDRIDPIILEARFVFSATGKTVDTLYLKFSEPLKNAATGPWIAWGKPSRDSLGTAVRAVGTPTLAEGDRTTILVDSTFSAWPGDSVRIFAKPTGALSDTSGNSPGSFAFWTPIEFGRPPLVMEVTVPTPILIDRGYRTPPGQQPITILVRKGQSDSTWKTLQGAQPPQPADSYSGVVLNMNRIPEGGGIYIYDLLGTAVVNFDLSGLIAAANAGQIQRTRRGDYQIFLAWDGRDMNGQKASTGIYIARTFGWIFENNRRTMMSVLKKFGIRRELPAN